MTVSVEPIVTADLPIPRAYALRGSLTGMLRAHCLAFVVKHPRAGTVLVDTGFHPDARSDLRRDFGLRMSLLFRAIRPARDPFDEQLRAAGVEPSEVERVVMTHLHVDHTSGMRLLPNARFTCTRAEWRAATGSGAGGRGYVAHHLPPEPRMDLLELDGEHDLLGDGSVRLVPTPGHTPGHMSVLLATATHGRVMLVGDAAYTRQNVAEQRLPLLAADGSAAARSLRELAALDPDVTLVPSHDPNAWEELRQ